LAKKVRVEADRAVGVHDDSGRGYNSVHRGLVQPERCTTDLDQVPKETPDLIGDLDNGQYLHQRVTLGGSGGLSSLTQCLHSP
jgi:hypothetical protein